MARQIMVALASMMAQFQCEFVRENQQPMRAVHNTDPLPAEDSTSSNSYKSMRGQTGRRVQDWDDAKRANYQPNAVSVGGNLEMGGRTKPGTKKYRWTPSAAFHGSSISHDFDRWRLPIRLIFCLDVIITWPTAHRITVCFRTREGAGVFPSDLTRPFKSRAVGQCQRQGIIRLKRSDRTAPIFPPDLCRVPVEQGRSRSSRKNIQLAPFRVVQ
jgi:hypothetical protein